MSDFKAYRISNKLILSGLSIRFFFLFLKGSYLSMLQCLCVFIFVCIMFLPIYYIRAIGAGDGKVFALICCFVGIKQGVQIIVLAFIIAGIFSIIKLVHHKIFFIQLQSLAEYITQSCYSKKVVPYKGMLANQKNVIHFSLPILLSTILVIGGALYY